MLYYGFINVHMNYVSSLVLALVDELPLMGIPTNQETISSNGTRHSCHHNVIPQINDSEPIQKKHIR